MHLTCTNMPASDLENALDKVRTSSCAGLQSDTALCPLTHHTGAAARPGTHALGREADTGSIGGPRWCKHHGALSVHNRAAESTDCGCSHVAAYELSLLQVKSYGIQNILALRGDPPKGQETFTVVEGGFSCALDLVKYIRSARHLN